MCYDYTKILENILTSKKNPAKYAPCHDPNAPLEGLERECAKKAFRAKARKTLQKAQDFQQSRFDTQSNRINKTLLNILDSQKSRDSKVRKFFLKEKKLQNVSKCKNILLYAPFGFEVDIFRLIFTLRAKKKKIFLPYIQGISFKMLPFRLPLQKNQYGIYESTKSQFNLTKIHIAVVPILGIDRSFGRVGFGKGMYDRAFATKKYTRKKQIPIIFVSRIPCLSAQILSQPHDLRGDYLVSAAMWCKRAQYGNNIRSDRVYNLWDSR